MIQILIDRFRDRKHLLEAKFAEKHVDSYAELVKMVIELLADEEYTCEGFSADAARIHQIDDGDYQGTLVFVIGEKGYQPNRYWYARIYYGSCSGCDALQGIGNYSSEAPSAGQVAEYSLLALHVVENLREMN